MKKGVLSPWRSALLISVILLLISASSAFAAAVDIVSAQVTLRF